MPTYETITELAAYLAQQNIGHLGVSAAGVHHAGSTTDTADTDSPSIWVNPRYGPPAPLRSRRGTYLENATITLVGRLDGNNPEDAWLERSFIDVITRTKDDDGELLQRAIRDLLHPVSDFYGRKLWTMHDLLVEQSRIWLGDDHIGQDDVAFDRRQVFMFDVRRKSLAGLPYAP